MTKADSDSEIKEIENKYFTTSGNNQFTNNILNAKGTAKELLNSSGLNKKIKTLAKKEKYKNWQQ